jgi:chromosome partitioning protein
MKTIAIINQKGGVGKTTTAINLSTQYAKEGKQVLVIDLDPQGNLSTVLSGGMFEFSKTIADVFEYPKKNPISSIIIPAATGKSNINNLSLCPADIRLSRVIEQSLTKIHRESILLKQLDSIKNKYDLAILDCPPNLSLTSVNAMMVADLFLIPIDGGSFSLNGLVDLLDALEEVKETEDVNFVVFRNEFAKSNKVINTFLGEQLNSLDDKVLKTVIRRTESIGQASVYGEPLLFFKPGSIATNDYLSLSKEVMKRITKL